MPKTIKADLAIGYVLKKSVEEVKTTANSQQWYLPHNPVQNPHKPDKLRRVCNAVNRFSGTPLNDVLLPGRDLLCDLIGIFYTFPFVTYSSV